MYWRKFLPQLYAPKGKWAHGEPAEPFYLVVLVVDAIVQNETKESFLVGNPEAWVSSLARSREGFLHKPPGNTFETDRPAEAP